MHNATMTKCLILSFLTVAIFFMVSTSTLAAQKNSLIITKVQKVVIEDENGKTMTKFTITGDNFSFGRDSVVTLGEIGPLTIVKATTDRLLPRGPGQFLAANTV